MPADDDPGITKRHERSTAPLGAGQLEIITKSASTSEAAFRALFGGAQTKRDRARGAAFS
jgi:hypothetical protein